MAEEKYTVLDLFCGCGGLSLGFEKAGYDVLLGIDIWKDALETYKFNHHNSNVLCADMSSLKGVEVSSFLDGKKVDVIIGGPPCQGFSIAGKRIVDDERNKLYKGFVRMVAYFKPRAFVMENVPNILSIGGGVVKQSILEDFQELGYNVETRVLLASDYGVPQNRRRAVFVGLYNGVFDFNIPTVEHKVTTEEALGDLSEESIADKSSYPIAPSCDYQRLMRANSNEVWNHDITQHNEQTKRIIALVPDGGNYKDLPKELQETRKVHIAWTRLNSQNLRKGKGIHQPGILYSCLSFQIVHHILQCIEVLDIPPLYIHNSLQQIALIHLWSSMLLIIHKTNQTYIARATNLRLFLLGTIKSVLKIYSNLLHNYLDFKLNIYLTVQNNIFSYK
jgi:DNA (cytosine-5)-methyltransferase 1